MLFPRLVRLALVVVVLGFASALAACGGSASETPPPLEPLPANIRYDRAATTLPGEIGGLEGDAGAPAPTDGGAASDAGN